MLGDIFKDACFIHSHRKSNPTQEILSVSVGLAEIKTLDDTNPPSVYKTHMALKTIEDT